MHVFPLKSYSRKVGSAQREGKNIQVLSYQVLTVTEVTWTTEARVVGI